MSALTYPHTAGHKGQPTSRESARTVDTGKLRNLCMAVLRSGNFTADEIAARLGLDKLSIRPRLSELNRLGHVEATLERRRNHSGKTAVVWRRVG